MKVRQMYLVEIDLKGNIISWNSVTLAFLGYSEPEIKTITIFDVVKEEQLQTVLEALERWWELPKGTSFDLTVKKKSGLWVDICAIPEVVLKNKKIKSIKCNFKER